MPKRCIGFTVQEVDVLLTAIERFLPIGPYEWDRVLAEHESHFPEAGRTKESLKRKFTMLYKTRHPTGDPDIPEDVLRAKRVYEEIKKKAEVSEGEGSDDDEWEEENHLEEGLLPQEGQDIEQVGPNDIPDIADNHGPEIAAVPVPPAPVAQQQQQRAEVSVYSERS